MKILKELKNFFCINVALVGVVLLGGYVYSTTISHSIEENINLNYSDDISKLSTGTFNGLEELVKSFAEDKNIIKLVKSSYNNTQKEQALLSDLKYAKGLLTATSFAESIDVVNTKSNQLYSSKGYNRYYDMKKRPWFKTVYDKSLKGEKVISTPLHKDIFDGRYSISIISFIKDSNEIIGCVILNAYMDTFTKYMSELYGNNDAVKIYIRLNDNRYYEYSTGIMTLPEIKNQKDISLVDKGNLLFVFDEKSNAINKTLNKINFINLNMFLIFFVFAIVSFFIIKRKILNLLFANLSKLKNILKQLNKYDEKKLEGKKGFEQLDFIVNEFDAAINENAKEYMLYDTLTGMLNRKGLEIAYKSNFEDEKPFALLFIDLNKFKNINDNCGHIVGDLYLKEFSKKLSQSLGKRGILARIAGDEFIVLLKDYTTNDELEQYFKKKVVNLFKKEKIANNRFYANFSVGVATYPHDGNSLSELVKKSDCMMYENKKKGKKNELAFFDEKIFKKTEEREILSMHLETAITKKELLLEYQPIVNNKKEIVKVEALLRWNNKKLGRISPAKFIEIAEKNGEIIRIGYWIINKVCEDINRLKKVGINNLIINVNVSAVQLLEENFARNFVSILKRNNVSFDRICMEITESVIIEDDKTSLENIRFLNKLGIQVSLDDFGTGYTSFSYLEKFAGNSLKIDKSILDSASNNEYHIINSIKEIGEELDFNIVVEGVETNYQFNELSKRGFKYFQGFYFSKPLDINRLENILYK